MPANDLKTFIGLLTKSIGEEQLVKLTLSDRRNKANELQNVFVKPVMLKAGWRLSFVYRYPTKDITKNYDTKEAAGIVTQLLKKDFYKADLFTVESHINYSITKAGKSFIKHLAVAGNVSISASHDRVKKRYVRPENNVWLKELGLITAEGKVKSDKQDKYRQINKYVEIAESIIKDAALPSSFQITDMGSGKGYLTFALYDYLTNQMKLSPAITGVELRQELVDTCNAIASKAAFVKLNFVKGSIENTESPAADVLIALHACDTATDQAIYRGIKGNSKVIICAPCCHKQVRKQIQPTNDLKAISKFGILEERQAEILTDTIRALIMEAFGYKTKVFEFISTEHTPKNLLIVGVKSAIDAKRKDEVLGQIKNIKALFNIEYHQLEKLMEI